MLFAVLLICGFIIWIGTIGSKEKTAVVFDETDKQIASITYSEQGLEYLCEEKYKSFVEVVVQEAIDILMEQENIKEVAAQKMLVEKQMHLKTTFKEDVLKCILLSYQSNESQKRTDFAAVLGGTDGRIYACYSVSQKEDENMVLNSTYPASTIKPLSVYGQMIESGQLCWSDKVLDAPYISEKSDGSSVEIPANARNSTYEEVFVETAVQKSLNTIPIRLLKEYGVQKSCDFLNKQFGVSLEREYRALNSSGEDEILANIALGYLTVGISPKDLFAYYQVFANGGTYQPAYTIQTIELQGECYYQHTNASKQVFSKETAYIVNRLLKQVVTEDGTGANAQIEGIDLCGKTGTSNNYEDNWFVGFTPQYIGAVWYDMENSYMERTTNESVTILKDIICQMEDVNESSFEKPEQIIEEKYCQKTGLLAQKACKQISVGYYQKNKVPKLCNCD